jgi:DNA-binding NarL/FixJ family response regulator
VRMPGMDGLDATKELLEKEPNTAVLIFTAYSERSLLARGLESGAKGYILKEAPHETLVRAIEKVAGGDSFIDPALMPAFLSGKDREEMLTAREREILQLLADGMSNADAAQRLFISQETVKSHVRHILAKLEADTRTHAVAIALRDAIID